MNPDVCTGPARLTGPGVVELPEPVRSDEILELGAQRSGDREEPDAEGDEVRPVDRRTPHGIAVPLDEGAHPRAR